MPNDSDRAYDSIWEMIRTHQFAQGAPLREARLAEAIGVSRTPVREALRRLAAEGIVELRPNRGAQLVELDAGDTATIFDVRALLEPYAAGLAAQRADADAVAHMCELLDAMDEVIACGTERLDELAALNGRFHRLIIDSAQARLAGEAIAVVLRTPLINRTFHAYDAEQLARSQHHHRELVAAIETGNPEWAKSVMRSHIEAARSIYSEVRAVEPGNPSQATGRAAAGD